MKNILCFIFLCFVITFSARAANVTTGNLPDASPAQTTDKIIVTRGNTTANVTESTLPGLVIPGSSTQVSIANGGNGYNFPHFYPSLNSVVTATQGTTITRICAVGNSTVFGIGSTGSTNTTGQNYPALSWPSQLATILTTSYGIKAHWNSFIGAGTNGSYFGVDDSRITMGSSWSQSTDFISLGLDTYKATTSTNPLAFLPTTNINTFRVFYIINSGEGTFTVKVNGGASLGTINAAIGANNTLGVTTFTTTLAASTINITEASGSVHIVGVEAWDSTQNWVSIINIGAPGATSSQLAVATNAYSPANSAAFAVLGCNLVLIDATINDYDTSIPAATTSANYHTIAAAAKAAGADVIYMTGVPTNPSGLASVATQYLTTSAIRALAVSDNTPLIDLALRWQSYAIASAWHVYADTVTHPNVAGYNDNANSVASVITPPKITSTPFVGAINGPINFTGNYSLNSATPLIWLDNSNTAGTTDIAMYAGRKFIIGSGGSAATSIANEWYVNDGTSGNSPLTINSSDFVGIGGSGLQGCFSSDTLGVCGNILTTGHLYQIGASAANTNAYLETNQALAASTSILNPGVLVFGGQNATTPWGMDLGYASGTSRYRTRIFGHLSGDISLSSVTTSPTAQSAYTDRMTIRGDTGFVGIGTLSPSSTLTLVSSTTGIVETQTNTSGTCTHTPGSSSETVSCSSDRKFKENITNPSFFSAWLWDFPVREYTLKSTGERVIGVVAQELQKVHPEMVHENADENGEAFLTVDAPNIWRLVRAIQELQAFAAFVCLIALLAAIWHFVHYHHHHRKKRDVG